jgi:N-acetylglucosamine malate deacetylase 1
MESTYNSVLAIGAHPDDIEFSCGGTIKKLTENNKSLYHVVLSPCNKSIPDNCEKDILYSELKNAAKQLEIKEENIITFQFPVRDFPAHRQEILEHFIELKKKINPDLVLLPNSQDIHQDHQVVHNEAIRAFKSSCILGYELPWNNFSSSQNYFVQLEERHIIAKLKAVNEYKTQKHRSYNSEAYLHHLAQVRGMQINRPLAETFELIRWIV